MAGIIRAPRPARDARLEINPPPPGSGETLLADQKWTVRWNTPGDDETIDTPVPPCVTWYYARDRRGSDRQRMVSLFCERFSGPLNTRWISMNPFRQDWEIQRDPGSRFGHPVLRSRPTGDPLISVEDFPRDFVVSARLRPRDGARNFGIAMRANWDDAACYTLRGTGELFNPENPTFLAQKQMGGLDPRRWYWYELGVRDRKGRVVVRARIWDGNHEQVLNTLQMEDPSGQPGCPNGKRISLLPGADYGAIYVDPWDARWLRPAKTEFEWDTRDIAPGKYYIIAVVDTGPNQPPSQKASDFLVTIQHAQ